LIGEKTWKDIWEDRAARIERKTHIELMRADGHDNTRSALQPDDLQAAQDYYWKLMDLSIHDSVYEVGCGCGAFLYSLWANGHKVGGIDLSQNLIDLAKINLQGQNVNFTQGEAIDINTKEKYDHVTSFGCFLYFPDFEYAEEVLLKMLEKANKTISVLDVPDEKTKDQCEKMRRMMVGPSYDTEYKGLNHLYFSKQWFYDFAEKHDLHLTLFDQVIDNYEIGKYRFCVILKRNKSRV